MSLMRRSVPAAVLWAALGLGLAGCGGSAPTSAPDAGTTQLRMVGGLYGKYLSDHAGAAPANEAQFVAALEHNSAGWKKIVATPQAFLTSPRDKKPLVMVYGSVLKDSPETGFPPVAHEAEDVDGQIMVIDARGTAMLKSAADVSKLFAK